jgi:hypothetical protein
LSCIVNHRTDACRRLEKNNQEDGDTSEPIDCETRGLLHREILISLGKIADPIGTSLFEGIIRSLRCQELKVATKVSKFCFPSPVGWHIQSARNKTRLDLAVMHRIHVPQVVCVALAQRH